MYLYKMLLKLTSVYITNLIRKPKYPGTVKLTVADAKFPKILIFVQIQVFIIGNKYPQLSSLKGQGQFIRFKNMY